jgi:hypothetical protein
MEVLYTFWNYVITGSFWFAVSEFTDIYNKNKTPPFFANTTITAGVQQGVHSTGKQEIIHS